MDNLLQPVLENFPKLFIEKQKSPSYVQMYTKNKDEIVMVCLKNKQTTSVVDSNRRNEDHDTEELELTGSPLKLDLSLHTILDDTLISDEPQLWSKEEGNHAPITVEKARTIANLYNKSLMQVPKEDSTSMWILCNPSGNGKPLLMNIQSDLNNFSRGIVNYEDTFTMDDLDLGQLATDYVKDEGISEDMVNILVESKYLLSGISYGSHSVDELLHAPHGGVTELACEWTANTSPLSDLSLQTPYISCKVNFEQEVIIGHLGSPCNAIWKSVCALNNINQMLVDMTAAGVAAVDLNTASVRNKIPGTRAPNNSSRLSAVLSAAETFAYTQEGASGGCVCVTDDTTSLRTCLTQMAATGSSHDFTYCLWDVLRDCDTAEELITLLIQALTFISSGKIRPFLDVNNNTYLSKLVLKLSRGHSQAAKVLKNLRASPPQALSLVAQVGVEKTIWEYTKVMTLLEHSFFIAGIWNSESKTHESIEQINQTIQDMTMTGDFSLNPFESLSTAEHSIRLDCESFYDEDPNELTVDDFASLKKHGLVAEKKDFNEVPLLADEIDISPWKNLLMKFAQVHACLEHLYRAEVCLRADFASLKPIAARLLEYYASDRSCIKTVGQLLCDPIQRVSMPIANSVVQDHLKKPAFWYRVQFSRKEKAADIGIKRDSKLVYLFTQTPVFPPSVWQIIEPQSEEIAEVTTIGDEVKYHCTKYTYYSNQIAAKLTL